LLLLSTITTLSGNALTAASNVANGAGNNNNNKVALLAFYDNPRSQFLNAKPILDQYGFKATFFVACNWLEKQGRMTWQDIAALQNQGHDIESQSMNHKRLTKLSASDFGL
jgi:peptidoglycan/xylan/chitin deacetylase (PgdA/CDA1 family)